MAAFDKQAALLLGLSQARRIGFKTLYDSGGLQRIEHCFNRGDYSPLLQEQFPEMSEEQIETALLEKGYEILFDLELKGIELITPEDPSYPESLKDLVSAPRWLFCKGNLSLLSEGSVAVVGTRSPSEIGMFVTRYVVSAVAEFEAPIISGLAKGIDSEAHEWALVSKLPTVSVLGTGIVRPYPHTNISLANRIVDSGGLLVSEYMPYAGPSKDGFVFRNRIQAALSKCVIAPEWRKNSGTAHTIRFAKVMGRASINVHMFGADVPEDHGIADHTVVVPKEQMKLWRILAASMYGGEEQTAQKELF